MHCCQLCCFCLQYRCSLRAYQESTYCFFTALCLFAPTPSCITSFLQSVITCAGKTVLTICKIQICFYFTMSCFAGSQVLQIHGQVTWGRTRGGFSRCHLPSDEAAIFKMLCYAALVLSLEPLQNSCPWLTGAYPLAENVSIQDQIPQLSVQILHLLLHWAQPFWEATYPFPALTCHSAAEHR